MNFNVEKALEVKDNFEKYKSVKSVLIKGNHTDENIKYSILIPTYKRTITLIETINSALNQDYQGNYNVIVCDNNPVRNDETEILINGINNSRLKYYKNEENIGMTGNMNRCVELCDGQYMILVHDDDILFPFFINQCDKILKTFPYIKFLYPEKKYWYQSKNSNPPEPDKIFKARLFKLGLADFLFTGIAPTGVLFHKDETIRLGGFDESSYPAFDLYFIIKAIENSTIYFYSMPLAIYRWGINETFKLKTLLGFVNVFNPLRVWMGKKLYIPRFIVDILNKNYNLFIVNYIKKNLPENYNSKEVSSLELLKNKFEKIIANILTRLIHYILKIKHRINSVIIYSEN